ncbi:MAG: TonB-dependent receptor, partial [Pseudomonadota bacterium]
MKLGPVCAKLRLRKVMLATTAIVCVAAPVAAQEAEEAGVYADQIIVTARKREETLQSVPVSVTAFTGAGLENRGISNLRGINNFTPNLELTSARPDAGPSAASIYIRGVGQSDFLFPNDPGVGLYVDDVYLARTIGGMLSLVDVERVEVLRGPQGTLYGKNTIGGAVKVVTKRPELNEFSGRIKATAGSFNRLDAIGSVNIPITDTMAARMMSRFSFPRSMS